MRTPTLLVLLIAAVTSAAPVPLPAAKAEWKAGVAAVDITPEHMMYLAGYASRNKPAEAVGQHLFAKALAIEDAAGARMVFVTLDLIGVPRPLRDEVVKQAGEKHKLPPEALLLNASHTHSGPEFRVNRVIGDDVAAQRIEDADAYGKRLTQLVLEAISQALAKLEPANIGYSHARCGVSMNRRLPTEKGYANSPNPDGPVD
jgi:hypothetical protein